MNKAREAPVRATPQAVISNILQMRFMPDSSCGQPRTQFTQFFIIFCPLFNFRGLRTYIERCLRNVDKPSGYFQCKFYCSLTRTLLDSFDLHLSISISCEFCRKSQYYLLCYFYPFVGICIYEYKQHLTSCYSIPQDKKK